MIHHHPSTDMLIEYANGSLPWALNIGVAAHVQLCKKCQQQVQLLNNIGGAALQSTSSEVISNDLFSRVMGRIDNLNEKSATTNSAAQGLRQEEKKSNTEPPSPIEPKKFTPPLTKVEVPAIIKKLLPEKVKWRRISSALKSARLVTGQKQYEVCFHKIRKGGTVVEHDHRGLEITVVLEGSFSDKNGVYQRGDFLVKKPGDTHQPTAARNHDCLCLSICEAPVKVTGLMGFFINPFLNIRPA